MVLTDNILNAVIDVYEKVDMLYDNDVNYKICLKNYSYYTISIKDFDK